MEHIKHILLILVFGGVVGSCSYGAIQSDSLRFCINSGKDYVNGNCVSKDQPNG